jgi:hypothetical protein
MKWTVLACALLAAACDTAATDTAMKRGQVERRTVLSENMTIVEARAWMEPLRGTPDFPLVQPAAKWSTYPPSVKIAILGEIFAQSNDAFEWGLDDGQLTRMLVSATLCMEERATGRLSVSAGDVLTECNAEAVATVRG